MEMLLEEGRADVRGRGGRAVTGRGERLPVILTFLLLVALPFLFHEPADNAPPSVETARAEQAVRQPQENDRNGQRNLPR